MFSTMEVTPSSGLLVAPTRHDVMGLRLEDVLKAKGNKTCADCPTKKPLWASYLRSRSGKSGMDDSSTMDDSSMDDSMSISCRNWHEMKGVDIEGTLAVLVCNDCAQHHHFVLGKKRCMIKYLKYTHELTPVDLDILENSGNALVNKYYEANLTRELFDKDYVDKDIKLEAERRAYFCKAKYKKAKYRDHAALAKLIPKLQRKRQIRELILEDAATTTPYPNPSGSNPVEEDEQDGPNFRRAKTMNDAEDMRKAVLEKAQAKKAAEEKAEAEKATEGGGDDAEACFMTALRRCKTEVQRVKTDLTPGARRARALKATRSGRGSPSRGSPSRGGSASPERNHSRRAVRRRSSFSDPTDLQQKFMNVKFDDKDDSIAARRARRGVGRTKSGGAARRRRSSFGDVPTSKFLGDFGNADEDVYDNDIDMAIPPPTNPILRSISTDVATLRRMAAAKKSRTPSPPRRVSINILEDNDKNKKSKPSNSDSMSSLSDSKRNLDLPKLRARMEHVKSLLHQSTEAVHKKLDAATTPTKEKDQDDNKARDFSPKSSSSGKASRRRSSMPELMKPMQRGSFEFGSLEDLDEETPPQRSSIDAGKLGSDLSSKLKNVRSSKDSSAFSSSKLPPRSKSAGAGSKYKDTLSSSCSNLGSVNFMASDDAPSRRSRSKSPKPDSNNAKTDNKKDARDRSRSNSASRSKMNNSFSGSSSSTRDRSRSNSASKAKMNKSFSGTRSRSNSDDNSTTRASSRGRGASTTTGSSRPRSRSPLKKEDAATDNARPRRDRSKSPKTTRGGDDRSKSPKRGEDDDEISLASSINSRGGAMTPTINLKPDTLANLLDASENLTVDLMKESEHSNANNIMLPANLTLGGRTSSKDKGDSRGRSRDESDARRSSNSSTGSRSRSRSRSSRSKKQDLSKSTSSLLTTRESDARDSRSRSRSRSSRGKKQDLSKSTSSLLTTGREQRGGRERSRSRSPKKDLSASSSALLSVSAPRSRSKVTRDRDRSKSPRREEATRDRSRSPKKAERQRRRSSFGDLPDLSGGGKNGLSEKQQMRLNMSAVLDVDSSDFL